MLSPTMIDTINTSHYHKSYLPATEALEKVHLMMKFQMLNVAERDSKENAMDCKRRLDLPIVSSKDDTMSSWDDLLYSCNNDDSSYGEWEGDYAMDHSSSSDWMDDDNDEDYLLQATTPAQSQQGSLPATVKSSSTRGLLRSKSIGQDLDTLPIEQSFLWHQLQQHSDHCHHHPCHHHCMQHHVAVGRGGI